MRLQGSLPCARPTPCPHFNSITPRMPPAYRWGTAHFHTLSPCLSLRVICRWGMVLLSLGIFHRTWDGAAGERSPACGKSIKQMTGVSEEEIPGPTFREAMSRGWAINGYKGLPTLALAPGRRGFKGPSGQPSPSPHSPRQAQAQPPGAGTAHLDRVFDKDHGLLKAQVPHSRGTWEKEQRCWVKKGHMALAAAG